MDKELYSVKSDRNWNEPQHRYRNEGHKLKQEKFSLIEEDRSLKGTCRTEMKLNNIDCSLKNEKQPVACITI